MEKMLIQQGDVLFKMVDALPEGLKKKKAARRGLVTFAEGEVTGHHHSCIADCIVLYEKDGTLYCSVGKEATVTHQEHNPVTLAPGNYEIGIVREVDHFADEIRRVAD